TDDFKAYSKQVIANAKAMADQFEQDGVRIVSGGTDNHLLLIDVSKLGLTGKVAEEVLDTVRITTNKNTIPFDKESPFVTSGVRIGTAALTTRGLKEDDVKEVAEIMALILKDIENEAVLKEAEERVQALTDKYPLYPNK